MSKTSENKKLYIQIYEEICDYIRINSLKPGDRLPTEMELCKLLSVSRTILRESLKSLEIAGIISSKPGVGIVLCDLNAEYFMSTLVNLLHLSNDDNTEVYISELRSVLELSLIDEVFNTVTPNEIKELEYYLEKMKKNAEERLKKKSHTHGMKLAEADSRFHKALYTNVRNKLIVSIISFAWAYNKQYKVTYQDNKYLRSTIYKHEKILEALKNHDYAKFKEAMNYHFKPISK